MTRPALSPSAPGRLPGTPARRLTSGLAISAAKVELLAHVAGQALRFGSGLVLSRLLFPEAFGLSVVVGIVSQGLLMLSNVGAGQSVVQSPNGDDPRFLNTAWTVLALRGVLLWIAACLAAYPLAVLLREPQLALLVPAGSLAVVVSGCASTSLLTMRRHLQVRPLVMLELAAQVLTLAANVVLASVFKSVWALIVGSLIGTLFTTLASHLLNKGERNRVLWDRSAWLEIYGYGRWIQASSALSFISSQADRFLIGHYITMSVLGIYNFAALLAEAVSSAVLRITHGVLFPLFSQIHRDTPTALPATYYRIRQRIDLLALLPMGVIAAASQAIVDLLFDARYASAGWMLQALCVRSAMSCMLTPAETLLFAAGHTRYGFYRDLARSLWVLPGIPLGWAWAGLPGVVWVVALSECPVLLVLWTGLHRTVGLRPLREAVGPAAFATGACGAAWALHAWAALRP